MYPSIVENNEKNDKDFEEQFKTLAAHIENDQLQSLANFLNSNRRGDFDIDKKIIDHLEPEFKGNKVERTVQKTRNKNLIHVAIIAHSMPAVRLLTQHGADINITYVENSTTTTKCYDRSTILEYYGGYNGVRTGEPEYNRNEYTPAELACRESQINIAHYLLSEGGNVDFTKLSPANKDELLKSFVRRNQGLEKSNKALRDKAKKNKEKLSKTVIERDKYKLSVSNFMEKHYQNEVESIQKVTRVFLARKAHKKRKRDIAIQVDKEAVETINRLAKKRRFNDICHLCETLINQKPIKAQSYLKAVNDELSKPDIKIYYLLLGEGDFSFSRSLADKLNNNKQAKPIIMVASDKRSFSALQEAYGSHFTSNHHVLEERNDVVMLGEVDATNLTGDKRVTDISSRYQRIYFNNPHDGCSIRSGSLRELVGAFFESARQLQQNGDKIHMLLPKEPTPDLLSKESSAKRKQRRELRKKRYQEHYNIYENAINAGYIYEKKLGNVTERYPHYKHKQTNANASRFSTQNLREHVFVRSDYGPEHLKWRIPYDIFRRRPVLPEMPTLSQDDSGYSSLQATPPQADTLLLARDEKGKKHK